MVSNVRGLAVYDVDGTPVATNEYAAAPVLKLLYYSMTGLPQFELTADQKPTMPDADTA